MVGMDPRRSASTTGTNSNRPDQGDGKGAESLFRKATGGGSQSVIAAIFWLKTRGGWREAAQSHKVAVTDLRQLSDADLERIILCGRRQP